LPRPNRGHYLRLSRAGTWHVCWAEPGGTVRCRSTGTADRGQAQDVLDRLIAELAAPPDPGAVTVREVTDAYLDELRRRTRWWPQHRSALAHFARCFGWLAFREVKPRHAGSYAERRRREGAADGTILQELRVAHAALGWHAGRHELTAPVFKGPKAPPPRRRWLTEEEAARLLAACEPTPHLRLAVLLALNTGARCGALLDLTWERVDLGRLTIDLGGGNGLKPRAVVPINQPLAATLREARELARSPFVIEWAGKRIGDLDRSFRRARAAAGLDDITFHDLRRTAGSWLIQADVPIALVGEMLGHRDVRITRRVYAHLTVEHLRPAATILGDNLTRSQQRRAK
jgi:integrase